MSRSFTVFLFPGTSHVMRAETLLEKAGLDVRLIPVPRHLSSDCGLCLRVAREDRPAAEAVIDRSTLQPEDVHDV